MADVQGPGEPAPSTTTDVAIPPVVTAARWWAAREELLAEEKALTRAKDALAARRRRLPVVEVTGSYAFVGPDGPVDLLGLFEGRRQLLVYRLFYAPDVENWPDGACSGCSLFADSVVHPAHLAARDTTLVYVSDAPQDHIARVQRRMGWVVPWYSLVGGDFSRDFDAEQMFALNVFVRDDEGRVYRSYVLDGRGIEDVGPVWSLLDLTPLGRQETWQDAPPGRPQGDAYGWWRLHDAYGPGR